MTQLLLDMSTQRHLLPGLTWVALTLLLAVLAPEKYWWLGTYGSKVKITGLALSRVTVIQYWGIAKSTFMGARYDIWGVLKEEGPEVVEGPLGELSGEDINSCCLVLLAIAIPMI
jgi:hypothetical protein